MSTGLAVLFGLFICWLSITIFILAACARSSQISQWESVVNRS